MTGSSSASKRPRQSEEEQCLHLHCAKGKKKHLYLTLYERGKGGGFLGLAIHKLDADNMPESSEDAALPEPLVRFAAPERAPMDVTAVGTSIFVATSPHLGSGGGNNNQGEAPPPPPTLVYDAETGALTIGPRLPDGYLDGDVGGVPTVVGGDRLYALTEAYDEELRQHSASMRVLSRTPTASSWIRCQEVMAWSWNGGGSPAPAPTSMGRDLVTSYALHPDGRTIFMSTPSFTWSFDTGAGDGAWKEIGNWSLPFTGQAYFDGDLDALVGLRHIDEDDGRVDVCCCRVPSRTPTVAVPPECKVLKEKLFFGDDSIRHRRKATLTYMGDSRFCLVENVPNSRDSVDGMLHVTLFGLMYDRNGELCTRARRTTRSYAVLSLNNRFSHAAFWM